MIAIRHLLLAATALAAPLLAAAPALADPAADFHALEADYWANYLKESPITASSVGVQDYDRQLDEIGVAAMDRQAAENAIFLTRLDAIPTATLDPADRANAAILHRQLAFAVEGNRYGARELAYSILGSYHNSLAGMADGLPFRNAADYDNYLARLALVPARMAAYSALSVDAARHGYTQPCVTMTKFEDTITGVVTPDPVQSHFYAPFAAPRPATIDAGRWAALQGQAKTLISDRINPAYRAFDAAYVRDIKARCRTNVAVSALPDGKAYYAFQVRQQTTTDLTPAQIHDIGLGEVARIRAAMTALAVKSGFASREAMIADMRTNTKYFAKSGDELIAAAALQAKRIDGRMPTLFGRLPRLPYGVKPIPAETAPGSTTAYYSPGSPAAGISGTYYVNLSKLDQRPLWELPALTAHEAVPGHHHQIALQQELAMPAWRQYTVSFTAFVEGWGLYSEHLGIELGIYDTPQKDMGRLSFEMWRACRLVVDTGIHAQGWSKERAVAYMKDNSALTDANIDAEVNRYISNPGQALAYKLGELKILELRARAERALGSKFDVRRFHDALLGHGPVPLDTLDTQINDWIAAEKSRS